MLSGDMDYIHLLHQRMAPQRMCKFKEPSVRSLVQKACAIAKCGSVFTGTGMEIVCCVSCLFRLFVLIHASNSNGEPQPNTTRNVTK